MDIVNTQGLFCQGAGEQGGHRPPSRARARVYPYAISQREWFVSIPENGRVAWLTSKREIAKEVYVNPLCTPESKRAITRHDPVREILEQSRNGGARRGEICGFSAKSRFRLLRGTACIDYDAAGLPVFLTLTYGKWEADPDEWKEDLNRFIVALRRKWKETWGLWKLEFQKRGAPHFHFILWAGPKVQGVRVPYGNGKWAMKPLGRRRCPENGPVFDWLDRHWGNANGYTRIEPVATVQGVMAYAGKYIGKVQEGETGIRTGRIWGIINRKAWKKNVVESRLDNIEAFRFRRVARKWAQRMTGFKSKDAAQVRGITVFMKSTTAERLKEWACEGRQGCPF